MLQHVAGPSATNVVGFVSESLMIGRHRYVDHCSQDAWDGLANQPPRELRVKVGIGSKLFFPVPPIDLIAIRQCQLARNHLRVAGKHFVRPADARPCLFKPASKQAFVLRRFLDWLVVLFFFCAWRSPGFVGLVLFSREAFRDERYLLFLGLLVGEVLGWQDHQLYSRPFKVNSLVVRSQHKRQIMARVVLTRREFDAPAL